MRRLPVAILVAALIVLSGGTATLLLRTGGADGPAAPAATPSPGATESLDQQIARVARIVAEVRGLRFARAPQVSVLPPAEVATRVVTEVEAYTPAEADLDRRSLALVGAIPPGTDLHGLLVTALGEQVAGFYDPEAGELVVGARNPDARVGRVSELTLAHELAHALVDQALGLPTRPAGEALAEDRQLAVQALVEGDAVVTMQGYAEAGFSPVDRLLLAGESVGLARDLGAMTELPHALQEALLFPYAEGRRFVEALHERGGWAAVDAAYATPPRTTAEILFPERYPAEPPAPVARAAEPGPPWRLARSSSFGAADLLLLLTVPGGDPTAAVADAREVVADWRGGRADLYVDGDASLLSVRIATADPARLRDALARWAAAWQPLGELSVAVGDDGLVELRLSDRDAG